jgi:hypothetical protein
MAAVLCLPCLSLGYLWDDYTFLTSRGAWYGSQHLVPTSGEAFYRPIPQGLYFPLLHLIDPRDGTIAHILNLAALMGVILLIVTLVARIWGGRAGLISGLVFAGLGCVPSLVAWVSCSQDLFAITFLVAAFLLRHCGKNVPALVCAVAAVFSKEPAIAAFPVLVFWDQLAGRPASRPRFQAVAYLSVAVAWVLVHPGVHMLWSRGFQGSGLSYVGLTPPEQWGRHLTRYLLTVLNIVPVEFASSWWNDRVTHALVALAILVGGFVYLDRRGLLKTPLEPLSLKRAALIGGLIGIPTLLAPVILIRHWAPYFACIPAVGLAVFAGPMLAKQRMPIVLVVLGAFLLCGAWYRGIRSAREPVWTERVFADAARATKLVRANFKTVLPSLPRGSQVVASVSSTGVQGIYSTLLERQALQVWYADPTLKTVTTQTRRHGAAHEFLVRVADGLDVITIDFNTGQIRTTTRERPDMTELGRPILNYARAVAAEGNTDRALRITQFLADSPTSEIYARRLAAMILSGAGRLEEAARLLDATPVPPRQVALDFVWTMLKEASYDERLDEAAFEAFGLSSSDPEVIRWIMRAFQKEGSLGQAAWYARRLLQLAPGDRESAGLLLSAQQKGVEPRRMPA